MGNYILTEKIYKILKARGFSMTCKICECPLQAGLSEKEAKKLHKSELMGDRIESKQQRRGQAKLYHSKCYEDSHYDLKDLKKRGQ